MSDNQALHRSILNVFQYDFFLLYLACVFLIEVVLTGQLKESSLA